MNRAARHLVVGTPCYGGLVSQHYTTALLALQQRCAADGIGFDALLMGGDALVTRARNFIATEFLHRDHATHLMFIDADIGFTPDAVLRLLDSGFPLCGGLYPLKTVDWARATAVSRAGGDAQTGALRFVAGLDRDDPRRQASFAPARVVGNGFMLIRRDVLLRMEGAYPALRYRHVHSTPDPHADSPHRFAFFDSMIDEHGAYLPEDYAFCRRWRDLHGEIWVDLDSQLTHHGTYAFTGDSRYMLEQAGKNTA